MKQVNILHLTSKEVDEAIKKYATEKGYTPDPNSLVVTSRNNFGLSSGAKVTLITDNKEENQ